MLPSGLSPDDIRFGLPQAVQDLALEGHRFVIQFLQKSVLAAH
jgi:hypothetical protein